MIEERILAAKQYVKTLFADRADGHDVAHTLRVYANAMRIAQAEGPCDLEIVGLSALLHDADDYKLFQTENNANARMFLEEIGVLKAKSTRFVGLSMLFPFSKNRGKQPESLEGKIVQDADRLDDRSCRNCANFFLWWPQRETPY
ncbi:MAG: HD domain-containing protein [Streptococcus salivarius]